MAAPPEVFLGVLVGRGVAAANMAAGQTQTQMQPRGSNLQTVLAALGTWSHAPDRVEVRIGHFACSLQVTGDGHERATGDPICGLRGLRIGARRLLSKQERCVLMKQARGVRRARSVASRDRVVLQQTRGAL